MEQDVIRERVRWALQTLRQQGAKDVSPPARVTRHTWSITARIGTPDGDVFLKYVRGAYRHEPGITGYLHALAPTHVPQIVAANDRLACWLVRDAGDPFVLSREPGHAFPRLRRFLGDHAALQRQMLNRQTRLLDLGAKDLRPARYPECLDAILSAQTDLKRDRITGDMETRLRAAAGPLSDLATELQDLAPVSVVHGDLRMTNIKQRKGQARAIDWGDAGVGPAFLDLVPLFSELGNSPLDQGGIAEVLNDALSHWTDHAPMADLQRAQRICRVVYPMLYAHTLIHARPADDPTLNQSHFGLLRFYLGTFLNRLDADGTQR